ncbi:MAG TPA: heavy metal translocating P-type ATPase, partial [Succinivibrionaceae bacterium]|nr:heavy metal translocating P-type ATPase [Succinivibrionaceae bacterium]
MKTVKIPFPGKYDYSKCCLIEAKLRSLSNVCSAFIGNGYLKLSLVKTDKASVAKTLLSASKILGGDLVRQQVAVVRNSKEQLSTKNVSENDINADFKAHRTQALISLGCFVFFEVMRRVSPTSFAATTLLRSAGVLLMSSQLLKSGIGEAIRDRKPNADTLTVTAVLASVAAGKPESSLTLLTLSNCAEMLTTLAAQKPRNN